MIKELIEDIDLSNIEKTLLDGRFVYFISNSDDKIIYIGQTTSLAYRVHEHKSKSEYTYLRSVPVMDHIHLNDAEFMYILKYKPKCNKEFPTPTFLTTKTRIISDGLEYLYDLNKPDITLNLHGKTRMFWVKNKNKRYDKFIRIVTKIIHTEKCHNNKQNELIKSEIDKLQCKFTRDEYGNPPEYKSTFIKDAIKNATDKLKDK